MRKLLGWILGLALIGVSLIAPAPLAGAETEGQTGGWVVEIPGGSQYEPDFGGPAIQSVNTSCSGQGTQYLLETYWKAGGGSDESGNAYLRCGQTAQHDWGMRHIAADHSGKWSAWANIVGDSWRNYMDWAITGTLQAPVHVNYRSSNDTYAYRAEVFWYNPWGGYFSHWVRVVVSADANNIITAFPESTP